MRVAKAARSRTVTSTRPEAPTRWNPSLQPAGQVCVLTPEPLSSPGVGKTALAARLVEIAMTNSATPAERLHLRIHAAHFCRQQDGDSLDPIQVVEAIGRQ